MAIKVQPDTLYLREGEYVIIPIVTDFPLLGVVSRIGLEILKVKSNFWILQGIPARSATEGQPMYITGLADPNYGGEDFNIKVVIQGYDGITNSSLEVANEP